MILYFIFNSFCFDSNLFQECYQGHGKISEYARKRISSLNLRSFAQLRPVCHPSGSTFATLSCTANIARRFDFDDSTIQQEIG